MRSVARQNWPLSFGVKPVKREAAALSVLSAGPPDDVETMSLSFDRSWSPSLRLNSGNGPA
jgi:hypothetical protein